MIKSGELLKRYNLQNGPARFRAVNSETKPFEIFSEEGCLEFEKLMLSMHLLDKYASDEKQLCFETCLKSEIDNVAEEAENLYSFLTCRKLTIKALYQAPEGKLAQKRLTPINQTIRCGAPCLFSGGLDSAAGAIFLNNKAYSPTLCHTSTCNITLGKALSLHLMSPYSQLPLIITDMRNEAADSTSGKTRGLLFLSNAITLASSLGHKEVFFAENGPLMINPPVSPLADPTKNAHPYLIGAMERIFNTITGSRIKINAIFKDQTKSEVVAKVSRKGIIDYTWSCFRVQCQSHMCGLCYACLVRRLSLLALGYEEPPDAYEFNPFGLDRAKLGGVALQDLDILHDGILFFERMLKKENITEIDLARVPEGFFKDPSELLHRFSLDMFLGIKKLLGSTQIGTLGKFASEVMREIPDSYLSEREEELKSDVE